MGVLLPQDSGSDIFDRSVEVAQSHLLQPLMRLRDEVVNPRLMVNDVRLQVVEVQKLGSLCLWEDEVQKEQETEPGVEGDPADDEEGP